MPWWGWVVFGGLLGWAELHLPGSYLMWLALGAAVTGIGAAVIDLSLEGQIGLFAAASAVSCGVGYFVYQAAGRYRREPVVLNERSRSMIGAHGIVCEPIASGQGKVRLGDSVWLASGPDLPVGAPVRVTAVNGIRVAVEPIAGAARIVA